MKSVSFLTTRSIANFGAMNTPMEHKVITFDADYNIRVLDADKHAASARLRDSCSTFDSKVEEVRSTAERYIGALGKVSSCIEAEKLRAIGLRNRVAAMREEDDAEREQLLMMKAIKQRELEKLTQEEKSLQGIIQEQETHMALLKGTC